MDGRIKPDLCAPGTNLPAPRSQSTSSKGWGLASPLPHYMYLGGTSIATGAAGGFTALLREAWQRELGGRAPSGPALKALAILGAQPVSKRGQNAPEPRWVAGFGRMTLQESIPCEDGPRISLLDESDPGLLTGEARRITVSTPVDGPFKAVLAWYDAPGEALINDLNLSLSGDGDAEVWGNHAVGETGAPDRTNNVEVIEIGNLRAGLHTLEVLAHNIPVPPQPFALAIRSTAGTVVSGTHASDAVPVPPAPSPPPPIDETPSDAEDAVPVLVASIAGIGSASAKRFGEAGILTVDDLLRAEPHALTAASGNQYPLVAPKIELLKHLRRTGLPEGIGPELPLSAVASEAPPEGVSVASWSSGRPQLLPLLLIFDQSRWRSIRIGHLCFG